MQIIAGLGNPGKKYEQNRHNVGFKVLETIAEINNFGPWRKKFQSQVTEGHLNSKKVMLIKPETFMNNSGMAISEVFKFFKLNMASLIVIHDDLDLKIGKIKLKTGGSSAGHNGLKSIDQHVGSNYLRLRLGIARPIKQASVARYVLSDFSLDDKDQIKTLIIEIAKNFEKLLNNNHQEFLNQINQIHREIVVDGSLEKVKGGNSSNVNNIEPKLSPLQRLIQKFKT